MRQVTGSKLVATVETLDALAGLLGVRRNSLKLTTLFNAGDSGWTNVSAFHASCDNKGPTIVLIRTSDGKSYGGYTSVSWVGTGSYQPDGQAFLFRMCPEPGPASRQHIRTEKFQVEPSHKQNAQYSTSSQGPSFGGGFDLVTFNTSGFVCSTIPLSYSTSGPLINSSVPKDTHNFQLEVLQVTIDPNGVGQLEVPWLEEVAWALEVQQMSLLIKEDLHWHDDDALLCMWQSSACVMASLLPASNQAAATVCRMVPGCRRTCVSSAPQLKAYQSSTSTYSYVEGLVLASPA